MQMYVDFVKADERPCQSAKCNQIEHAYWL